MFARQQQPDPPTRGLGQMGTQGFWLGRPQPSTALRELVRADAQQAAVSTAE